MHDFVWAGCPERRGRPNLHFPLQVSPFSHLHVTTGVDNVLNGILDESPTWFLFEGLRFTDNTLK